MDSIHFTGIAIISLPFASLMFVATQITLSSCATIFPNVCVGHNYSRSSFGSNSSTFICAQASSQVTSTNALLLIFNPLSKCFCVAILATTIRTITFSISWLFHFFHLSIFYSSSYPDSNQDTPGYSWTLCPWAIIWTPLICSKRDPTLYT